MLRVAKFVDRVFGEALHGFLEGRWKVFLICWKLILDQTEDAEVGGRVIGTGPQQPTDEAVHAGPILRDVMGVVVG